MDQHPIQVEQVEIPLVTVCYRNREKLQPYGQLGLNADLTCLCHRRFIKGTVINVENVLRVCPVLVKTNIDNL